MNKDRVLLVEDDSTLLFIIQDALSREGFDVECACDGESGLKAFYSSKPDIVIADVMMPRMDGFEMVKRIRTVDCAVPVIFLTARNAIDDVVNGFDLGCNDYIRKPFRIIELVVRIRAQLKRVQHSEAEDSRIDICDCSLDFSTQLLKVGHSSVALSHIEAVILDELFRHPNEVVEARTLMLHIWQNDDYNNLNRLHGFIYKIRKYLAKSQAIDILNIRGIGYKLSVHTACE